MRKFPKPRQVCHPGIGAETSEVEKWIKQTGGSCIISDLPSVPEIAAIAKELRKRETQLGNTPLLYNPSSTLTLVRKWGPSTRNILRSMKRAALEEVDPIEAEAGSAAERICKIPSAIFDRSGGLRFPQSEGSSVIFLRRTPDSSVKLNTGKTFIPTPYLLALVEEQRKTKTNKEKLELFFVLSSHALTRPSAGWAHKKSMHSRLCIGTTNLTIFRDSTKKHMQPSTRLLPGALAGLKEAGANDSYWMPSVANFSGVDGVLGDTDGHFYTIQATIASEHPSPELGIKKVWKQFRPEVRISRTWHFVVVADTKKTADKYVEKFSEGLCHFTLGESTHVQVWGCVPSS